jgi:hypothetical protein
MRHAGDESVESVEKGGGPDVEHSILRHHEDGIISNAARRRRGTLAVRYIQAGADDDTPIVILLFHVCFRRLEITNRCAYLCIG